MLKRSGRRTDRQREAAAAPRVDSRSAEARRGRPGSWRAVRCGSVWPTRSESPSRHWHRHTTKEGIMTTAAGPTGYPVSGDRPRRTATGHRTQRRSDRARGRCISQRVERRGVHRAGRAGPQRRSSSTASSSPSTGNSSAGCDARDHTRCATARRWSPRPRKQAARSPKSSRASSPARTCSSPASTSATRRAPSSKQPRTAR